MEKKSAARKHASAFTLVELIVVITILAILGTIGLLSIQGYSKSARDSSRVSDLVNLAKAMEVLTAGGGTLPLPDANMLTITASGTTIGYQGYAGKGVLGALSLGGKFQDPVDNQYYTYLTNVAQNKYQILGLLEDSGNPSLIVDAGSIIGFDTAYAASYDSRFPLSHWGQLGVFLGTVAGSTLNQPIQENYSAASFTGIDVAAPSTGIYKSYIDPKNILSGTGKVFLELYGRLDTSAWAYPGCDTPNLKLPNGQVWAACNVWATVAYVGTPITNCSWSVTDCNLSIRNTIWSYFQWWRNDDVTPQGTPTSTLAGTWTTAGGVGHSNLIMSASSPYDWIATQNDNFWWWQGTTSSAGTYFTQSSANQALMKWPCAAGYHVPTQKEWCDAALSINPALTCAASWQNDTSIAPVLKLPLAGYRNRSNARYEAHNAYGYYWASSPLSPDGTIFTFISAQVRPVANDQRAFSFSVRCMKN